MVQLKMKFHLMPCLPAYPGTPKNYPKFTRTDNRSPNEIEKTKALTKLVRDEFDLIGQLARSSKDQAVFRRLQLRHFASVVDAFFSMINATSFHKEELGFVHIPEKDRRKLLEASGVFTFYKTSIKVYAKAMGVPSPNGDRLQIRGAATFWPRLRARITHPSSIEHYQFTGCDSAILVAIANWFNDVNGWVLELQTREIDTAKQTINNSMNRLRQQIESGVRKSR